MAFIMAVLPGMSIEAMDAMDVQDLLRWQERAAAIDHARHGKG